jgi:hypothetical protein
MPSIRISAAEAMKLLGGKKPRAKKVKSLGLSEKEVTKTCLDWLRSRRWHPIRLNSGLLSTPDGRRIRIGTKGLLDWIVLRGEVYCLLEMKATGKKPSEDQEEFMRFCAANKMPAIWADGLGRLMIEMQRLFGEF